MKKIIMIFIAVIMLFITACGNNGEVIEQEVEPPPAIEETNYETILNNEEPEPEPEPEIEVEEPELEENNWDSLYNDRISISNESLKRLFEIYPNNFSGNLIDQNMLHGLRFGIIVFLTNPHELEIFYIEEVNENLDAAYYFDPLSVFGFYVHFVTNVVNYDLNENFDLIAILGSDTWESKAIEARNESFINFEFPEERPWANGFPIEYQIGWVERSKTMYMVQATWLLPIFDYYLSNDNLHIEDYLIPIEFAMDNGRQSVFGRNILIENVDYGILAIFDEDGYMLNIILTNPEALFDFVVLFNYVYGIN